MSTYIKQVQIDILTDGAGACTVYSNEKANGLVSSIRYVKSAGDAALADGSTITLTTKDTATTIFAITGMNATATHYPRAQVESTAGVGLVYIAAGQAIPEKIAVCDELIQCVVANGGATNTGTIYVTLE